MGTRSDIIVHCVDGKWRRIYCHWDGYLEHNGRILFEHYTSQKTASDLVALGALSVLGPELGKKHPFEWRDKFYQKYKKIFPDDYAAAGIAMAADPKFQIYDKMCLAYHRDRGEPWAQVQPAVGETLQEVWPPEDSWTEFTYVWAEDKWHCGDPDEGTQTLLDLGDLLLGKRTLRPLIKMFGGIVLGRHSGAVDLSSSPE